MCNAHPFGDDDGLVCTGAGHPWGHTFEATGGGVDAEAAGDET